MLFKKNAQQNFLSQMCYQLENAENGVSHSVSHGVFSPSLWGFLPQGNTTCNNSQTTVMVSACRPLVLLPHLPQETGGAGIGC